MDWVVETNNRKNGFAAFEYNPWFDMFLFIVTSILVVFWDKGIINGLVELSGWVIFWVEMGILLKPWENLILADFADLPMHKTL